MHWAADNPRIKMLWELLKRTRGYRTGVVTKAYVADATPAGEGSHTISRTLSFEIARQYFENPLLGGELQTTARTDGVYMAAGHPTRQVDSLRRSQQSGPEFGDQKVNLIPHWTCRAASAEFGRP